ncbi:MAG: GxxExxY protein [Phycisphaerae bacterium]|jgi:GxxExxY protein
MTGDYRDEGSSYGGQYRSQGRGSGRGQSRGGGERRGIPLSDLDPATTEASRKAIGASIEVHKALGPGYDASVYASAVRMELDALGVSYKLNQSLPVTYREKQVGTVTVPMLVEDRFVLEIMSRPGEVSTHERLAVRAQLKAANLDLGLIVNFAERRLKDGLVRVVNVEKIQREKGLSFDDDQDMGHDEGQ